VIWRAAFDPVAVNWTTWAPIANLSNAAPNPPRHGGAETFLFCETVLALKNRVFAKTGSGQTYGKVETGCFLAGGQGGTHPLMDVDLPATGPFALQAEGMSNKKLVLTLDANNNQNYSRFHLGSAHWDPGAIPAAAGGASSEISPSPWAWTAMPGGSWNVTACNVSMDTPDGAIFGDNCVRARAVNFCAIYVMLLLNGGYVPRQARDKHRNS